MNPARHYDSSHPRLIDKKLGKFLLLSMTCSLLTALFILSPAFAYYDTEEFVSVSYAGQGDESGNAIGLACRVDECPDLGLACLFVDACDPDFSDYLDIVLDPEERWEFIELVTHGVFDEAAPRQQYIGSLTTDSHIKLEVDYGGFIDPMHSTGAPSFTPPDSGGTRLFTTKIQAEDSEIVVVGLFNNGQVIAFRAIDAQSNDRPHIAFFRSRAYVVYNDLYSRGIYVARGTMGEGFTHRRLPGESASAPTLVEFNNKLYIFYRGHQSKYLYYTSSSDGVNWGPERRINKFWETTHSPYPAVMGGRLYLAYKDSSTHYVSMTSTSDGVYWQAERRLPTSIKTDQGPALAVHNGEIFLFFKEKNSDRLLYSTSLDGGVTWSSFEETGAHTSESLSAVSGDVEPGPVETVEGGRGIAIHLEAGERPKDSLPALIPGDTSRSAASSASYASGSTRASIASSNRKWNPVGGGTTYFEYSSGKIVEKNVSNNALRYTYNIWHEDVNFLFIDDPTRYQNLALPLWNEGVRAAVWEWSHEERRWSILRDVILTEKVVTTPIITNVTSNRSSICPGQEVTITAHTSPSRADEYQWSYTGNVRRVSRNLDYIRLEALDNFTLATVTVRARNNDGNWSPSKSITISKDSDCCTVPSSSQLDIKLPPGLTGFCRNVPTEMTFTTPIDAAEYKWSISGNGWLRILDSSGQWIDAVDAVTQRNKMWVEAGRRNIRDDVIIMVQAKYCGKTYYQRLISRTFYLKRDCTASGSGGRGGGVLP